MHVFTRFPHMILILIVASFVLVPAGAAAAPRPAANCENIDEIIGGWSIPEFDEDGNFIGNDVFADWLGGELVGRNTVTKMTPGGVIHFTGALSFTGTDYGSFQATAKGVVAPNGNIKNTITLDDGTGFFTVHGTFDLGDGTWLARWHGRICTSY
jgi:hypothetical protein